MNNFVPLLIILALIGGGGAALYFFVIKKKDNAPVTGTVTGNTGWQFQYSIGVNGTPEDFDFPSSNGVHYCVHSPSGPLAIGNTVNFNFTISGTGTLVPVQGTYPYVSLYIQRSGDNMSGAGDYQQYRYYHAGVPLGNARDYSISIPLDVNMWSDVLGSSAADHQSQFLTCLANAQYIGFVFGDPGAGATGHGVYANGPLHFHLNEYSVT